MIVEWSWDLELVDVDNDHDLDVLVACKECTGSFLFRNDGSGAFTHDADALPQYTNNYDFEAMDLDGDGYLELVTINDGPGLRQHMFSYDPSADAFVDVTDARWPPEHNLGADDNVVAFVDVDADGDADFAIGSLSYAHSLDTCAARPDDPLAPARSAGDAAVRPFECAAMPALLYCARGLRVEFFVGERFSSSSRR